MTRTKFIRTYPVYCPECGAYLGDFIPSIGKIIKYGTPEDDDLTVTCSNCGHKVTAIFKEG